MEHLWRHPHGLARLDRVRDERQPSSLLPQHVDASHRRWLFAAAILVFLAHTLVLAVLGAQHNGTFVSNLLQFILGLMAFLAMLDAGRRSQAVARSAWNYAATAIGTYTFGQLIFIGYTLFGHGPRFAPRISDQFFFFWVMPFVAAAVLDPFRKQESFDSTDLLDLAQFVILGLALHAYVFADSARWQQYPQQMEFLKVKARIARDLLVLGCLWGRAWLTRSRQLRELFVRLGLFYLIYSAADAVYLYWEAVRNLSLGTWFDLLWSLPRLLAVVLALTWNWQGAEEARSSSRRPSKLRLWIAPAVVPVVMLAVGFRTLAKAPILWATMMVGSFAVASVRLLITQSRQERTLAELHHSNELLHSIIEGASQAIYLKDREGRYRLINAAGARCLGRSPEAVLGKTDRELLAPETVSAIQKTDQAVLTMGQSVTCEESLTEQGMARTFLSTKNPYHDSEGRVTGVLGISVDITERRQMEEQLRRAQRMESIGAFSGAIAHDFSNVLTVIKGYSQITHTGLQDRPALQQNLENIVKATDRAAALVRHLLVFSQQQVLQPKVISLNTIISGAAKMVQRLIGCNIEMVTRLADDLWLVKADPSQIEHVLMNLAAQARDSMPGGGKLFLETANTHLDDAYERSYVNVPAGDYAMFSLIDTGSGMDEETRAHIFEPFFTTKSVGKSTGLGLASAYGIVRQSGGCIAVESTPGAGSTFTVFLPRAEEDLVNG